MFIFRICDPNKFSCIAHVGFNHPWRSLERGLIPHKMIAPRKSREEEVILIDHYAAEQIDRHVPLHIRLELDGWARSFYTHEAHMNAIKSYNKPKLPPPSDTAWSQTLQHTRTIFNRLPKVNTIPYTEMDRVKWVRSSAAGYGYTGLKGEGDNYEKARKTAFTLAEMLHHDPGYGVTALLNQTPDVAFTRTQLCQIKVKRKVRNVWGEAFHHVLLEGLFADALIKMFAEQDTFYFIGRDPLLSVPLLIAEILSEYDYVYMFDWSGFDATVQEWEIRFAFECLESLIKFPSNVERDIWHFIIELFIYRLIAAPDGTIYLKTMGIPSGSCFTNIVGSIVNYIRIQYLFKRLTDDWAHVFTHGDDSLAGVKTIQYVPMANFGSICNEFLWAINLDKSRVSNQIREIGFLSREVRELQHNRDELVCLRMLKFPEYEVENGGVSTLRAYSIFRDAGVQSRYLFKIYKSLNIKYGKAEFLPLKQRNWNPIEYELLRQSRSEENLYLD
ncbi:putative RdRp [Alloteropsis cryptic virus 1]|nr:putative RdRp [Alloteropsis cryptic virus 1]